MTIKLAVTGCEPIVLDQNEISVGSAQNCGVSFLNMPNVKPKHAVIRMIAGRWLVEVREAESIYVNSDEPKRMQWLQPGDLIRLTLAGPEIIFQPSENMSVPAVAGWRKVTESHEGPPSSSERIRSQTEISPPPPRFTPPAPLTRTSFDARSTPVELPETRDVAGYRLESRPLTDDRALDVPAESNSNWTESVSSHAVSEILGDRPSTDDAEFLKRLSFDESQQVVDLDQAGSENNTEIQWISKIVFRSVVVGFAFLLIWLIIMEILKLARGPA